MLSPSTKYLTAGFLEIFLAGQETGLPIKKIVIIQRLGGECSAVPRQAAELGVEVVSMFTSFQANPTEEEMNTQADLVLESKDP